MLDRLTDYFTALPPGWLYFSLFGLAYLENVFPPIPGDTVLVFAAYLVGRSQQHYMGVFLSTTIGSVAGFMTYYVLGRLVGLDYFLEKNFRFLTPSRFQKAGAWIERYGYWIVLANRFLAGVRSVISIVAGIYRLSWVKVFLLSLISCAVWHAALIWIGFLLGSNWRYIEDILRNYNRALLALAVVLGAIWFLRRRMSSQQSR